MRTCLIDLRCLQDPPYRERGIGRHARALLSHARTLLPGTRLVGLTDMAMPPVLDDVRAMVDAIRITAYTGALQEPCCFVQLSPMTHDPLFVARLLAHPAIPTATVVYDFIPYDEPDRYLNSPALRLDYHLALRWLARYDLLLPISDDAARALKQLLDVDDDRIVVTGAPLAPAFQSIAPGTMRHVLVIGGNDPRKNPECAIHAHTISRSMQTDRVRIVVTGEYEADWIATQRAAIATRGGDPALLHVPGHVPEKQLLSLYANAVCVVAPSRAEGFSLPVVEAMAAGLPVLASDIPVHRALLDDGLFDPDDPVGLAMLLQRLSNPTWRGAKLSQQAKVWPQFTVAAVAARFWAGVDRLEPTMPPASVAARPRVALLTPLPPDRSGVADYSAVTCAALGKLVELHVFTPTIDATCPEGAVTVAPLSAFPLLAPGFDRVVGVLGNSVFHLAILRLLLRHGGGSILHDGRMLDLYAGHISLEKTIAMAEKELARPLVNNEVWRWLNGDVPPAALILADVAAAAEPLMMHSQAGVTEVAKRYDVAARHLPFSLYRIASESDRSPTRRLEARRRLGIAPDETLLTTFGYVHPSKAPIDCVWALSLLRRWGVNARLHFVGAPLMETGALLALIHEQGLSDRVLVPAGFVDEDSYRDHLVAADVGIQLRISGPGSVSGALADCIGAGLRTVASLALHEALDAPDFVRAVPDSPSPVLVAEAAVALLAFNEVDASRQSYVTAHGFDAYADRLCEALGLA